MGLALDEPKDADEVFDRDGVKFVIDKGLLGETQPVKLDYINTDRGSGFQITSALTANNSCGSCSC